MSEKRATCISEDTQHISSCQGVANDVEWGETDKLNMSGWGEGGGGNVQGTMADVHYEESHKTSRHFFQLVN